MLASIAALDALVSAMPCVRLRALHVPSAMRRESARPAASRHACRVILDGQRAQNPMETRSVGLPWVFDAILLLPEKARCCLMRISSDWISLSSTVSNVSASFWLCLLASARAYLLLSHACPTHVPLSPCFTVTQPLLPRLSPVVDSSSLIDTASLVPPELRVHLKLSSLGIIIVLNARDHATYGWSVALSLCALH